MIHDRDTKFAAAFDQLLAAASFRVVKSPVMAPNANASAESWIATVKRECFDYFACFGLGHIDHLVQAYAGYYNRHRPHQGLDNRVLSQSGEPALKLAQENRPVASIGRRSEPDGLLKSYYCRSA